MNSGELQAALAKINEIEFQETKIGFDIFIPAIDKYILLVPERIAGHQFFVDPFDNTALRLMLRDDKLHLLIISQRDFVFEPVTSDVGLGLDHMMSFTVTDMPPLIGYSEIAANLERFSRMYDKINRIDLIIGQMILLRYGINGAKRVGIDCPELEEEWQALSDDLQLYRLAGTVKGMPHGSNEIDSSEG